MTSDERFDRLLRGALEWQAGHAVATQPSQRQATRQLAQRIGTSTTTVRPRLSLAPSPLGSLNLITLLLLLLALLGVALYVGAQLLRPPSFVPPNRLGFGSECTIPMNSGLAFDDPSIQVVLSFTADDGPDADSETDFFSLYADGRLVQDISIPGETRADNITGSQVAVRRLTPEGVDLMLGRVSDAGLTPGCRFLRTQESDGGQLTAVTGRGATEVSWGPGSISNSYVLAEDDEAILGELTEDLAHPEDWLPATAWLDSTERLVRPDHWLIYLVLRPTNHRAGDEVQLPDGNVLHGSDPRSESIELPDGADPVTFGSELPLSDIHGPGSRVRCAPASREDAVSLATSLETLANGAGIGTDGEGDLFTPDLTQSISLSIQPIYGAGYDCAALAETWRVLTQPGPTSSPPPPAGDMANIDPCTLIGVDARTILDADNLQARRSRLPVGVPAHACVVSDSTVVQEIPDGVENPLPAGYKAMVTLYPESVGSGAAEDIVDAVFGAGLIDESIGGHPGWTNPCLGGPDMPCSDTTAAWSRSHLLFFEFTNAATPIQTQTPSGWSMTWEPHISRDLARSFVEAVIADLQE